MRAQGVPQGQPGGPGGQPGQPGGGQPTNFKPLVFVKPILHINGYKEEATLAGGEIQLPGGVNLPIPAGLTVCAQPQTLTQHAGWALWNACLCSTVFGQRSLAWKKLRMQQPARARRCQRQPFDQRTWTAHRVKHWAA